MVAGEFRYLVSVRHDVKKTTAKELRNSRRDHVSSVPWSWATSAGLGCARAGLVVWDTAEPAVRAGNLRGAPRAALDEAEPILAVCVCVRVVSLDRARASCGEPTVVN